jgi:hypothetical protein
LNFLNGVSVATLYCSHTNVRCYKQNKTSCLLR